MQYDRLRGKRILLVEDDPALQKWILSNLRELRCEVYPAGDVQSAKAIIATERRKLHAAIVDLYIPDSPGEKDGDIMRGEALAVWIHEHSPSTMIGSFSKKIDQSPITDLTDLFKFHVFKGDIRYGKRPTALLDNLDALFSRAPKVFIVHGHDEDSLERLVWFLSQELNLGKPVVLRESRLAGDTIIEKFEREARYADFVFVLATADDEVCDKNGTVFRQPRQNVIFELGYFYGTLRRTSGRVIVLKKTDAVLPSDIGGIEYIEMPAGIETAYARIRATLGDFL